MINRNTQEVQLKSVKEGKSTYNFHTEKLSKNKIRFKIYNGKIRHFNHLEIIIPGTIFQLEHPDISCLLQSTLPVDFSSLVVN